MYRSGPIVIAGGGTGGHIYPGLAIASALEELGIDRSQIIFFGSNHKIESTLVPQAGFTLVKLPGSGLNTGEPIRNVLHICGLLFACLKVLVAFVVNRPRIVIGVGGYASAPALVIAALLGIGRVLHEQNSVMGRSNLLAQKLGAVPLLTFHNTIGARAGAKVVGMPMRSDFSDECTLRQKYVSSAHTNRVVVTGGSMGSLAINNAVINMIEKYYEEIDFSLIHITGKQHLTSVEQRYRNFDIDNKVTTVGYRDDLIEVMAQSDCVIARGGASTCIELEILAIPSVIIPLPQAPGDHQRINAKGLEESGLGIVLKQSECGPENLYEALRKALHIDRDCMSNSYHLDARRTIAHYIFENYLSGGHT